MTSRALCALLYPPERVPVVYAVLDPRAESVRWVREAIRSDVVELESRHGVLAACGCCLWLTVRRSSLMSDQLGRLGHALAARSGSGFGRAVFEIHQGHGLALLSRAVFVCADPAIGRAYWAGLAPYPEKGGGS